MNKNSEILESGQLFNEAFDFMHITWKIRNFLSLPNIVDSAVNSSSFSFAGGIWQLRIYPYGETNNKIEGFINVDIVRQNSLISEHHVFFKIYFQTRNGKEFESYSSSFLFNSENILAGVINFMRKSTAIEKKNLIVPGGVLTVVCQLRTKKLSGITKQAQTESATLLGCDCMSRPPLAHPDYKALCDFKELFLKQDECDVIMNVQGKEFKAHKAILIARSPVFAAAFKHDMKEKAGDPFEIEDCDPSSFSDFLCFLYCGKVENLSAEIVFSLFTTADKYEVQDLRSECLEFIKYSLSVDTFCETVTLALQHSEKELLQLAIDFFFKHFREIIVTVKWQSFVVDNPIQSNEIMVKAFVPNEK